LDRASSAHIGIAPGLSLTVIILHQHRASTKLQQYSAVSSTSSAMKKRPAVVRVTVTEEGILSLGSGHDQRTCKGASCLASVNPAVTPE
jgi:hypothetical protein